MKSSNIINIIDYGNNGNLSSLNNSLKKIDKEPRVIKNKNDFPNEGNLILPGVGSFDNALDGLKISGLYDKLLKININNYKILGICLGMQILGNTSEESVKKMNGLGFLNIDSNKFYTDKPSLIKIPHIGWKKIHPKNNLEEEIKGYFYFLHSFYVKSNEESAQIYLSQYFQFTFPSFIIKGDIFSCQFHPEKSGIDGLNFLKKIFN